ncbi:MAG: TasA family protein [Paraclostridium sp.]|uniref:TasA family protein n=1 Tax=Paraclostridium sp. TaxID=2023273 RepID=UPI003F32849C
MSRLKRLKYKRKQNREAIKASMTSIVLALGIGTCGSLDTYAYFADEEMVSNDLNIEMGNLDVSISEGLNVEGLKENQERPDSEYKEFYIKNEGSLKQNLSIKFEELTSNNMDDSELSKLTYEVIIHNKDGVEILKIEKNLKDLLDGESIRLVDLDGNKIKLNKDESILCKSKIKSDTELSDSMSNKVAKFKLIVKATQTETEKGFFDIATQVNTISMDEIKNIPDINLDLDDVKFEDCPENENCKKHCKTDEIEIKCGLKKLPDGFKYKFEYIDSTGQFSNIEIEHENKNCGQGYCLEIDKKNDMEFELNKSYGNNNILNMSISIVDSNGEIVKSKEFKIYFRYDKNVNPHNLEATLEPSSIIIDSQLEEPSIEEVIIEPPVVEIPNEPEIEQLPVVETPSKPEIEQSPVEKVPSEPEIEQKPIEEVPNKPELIEPPKEQEKTDIDTQENPEI